ncbi:hypothetical protein [Novosphingobium sp. 9U]|uniref:hypothetical protein n=1 Tax=Novosphingobium sp. 9U TaxID=2653158 RepID=UPI00135A0285|nr:hypothetical protein [Novosphingobium sp. 9U]
MIAAEACNAIDAAPLRPVLDLGETPFPHAYARNVGSIASFGLMLWRELMVIRLGSADSS